MRERLSARGKIWLAVIVCCALFWSLLFWIL